MRRLTFLLRPSWLVLALVVGGFAYACFTVLAPWQLGKNTTTEERNDRITASLATDPVPVEELLTGPAPAPEDEWRRVVATGSYLPDSDLLVRLRSVESSPAYEVLTPFRLADGRTVLVNRGYVRPERGTEIPGFAPAPAGPVTVDARLRMSEGTAEGKTPFRDAGHTQVYSIDPAQIAAFTGLELTGGYLQLSENQAGGLGTIPLPQLDAGPYLSYGLQWVAFGIMAPLGLGYFVWAELRERRKRKDPAPAAAPEAEPVPAPVERSTEDKLADRYGRSR
ncbi:MULTISPECIES: SURF1 family protein [Rhodococcus]|uniref:SURF1 family cytochrome oxidase biogenesis protein n=1 Tax=Rhodococcus TaxID=1827 RepID=UPI00163961B1|nr:MULTISPECIES: SURF1 family protein [Rhodococcus]MBC2588048.1 SURF1 family protein [Rhodococcus aetherivorans]QRI73935.1 SURF1 family protein [Rhodococcus aetherivorans]QSE57344.1 SURF1 family protein [Rhodococcus sp. PSBB066]QSE71318.1 SURF1 family protein [Rhodococcus sp. PSBB049]